MLKEQIIKETFASGELLPTEQNLAQKYLVSCPTIAKVYNHLQEEGNKKEKRFRYNCDISFRQPCEEIANMSIELLMRRIENVGCMPVSVNLTGEIIIRESSLFI